MGDFPPRICPSVSLHHTEKTKWQDSAFCVAGQDIHWVILPLAYVPLYPSITLHFVSLVKAQDIQAVPNSCIYISINVFFLGFLGSA